MTAPDDLAGGSRPDADNGAGAARLADLRAAMVAAGIDAFAIPRTDAHQGEFVAPRDERLAWLTGFTGSAGMAIVHRDAAAIFVDGRYTLQVETEVDGALYVARHASDEPPDDWLAGVLAKGEKLGFDPWLHSVTQARKLAETCEQAGAISVAVADNPLDAIWADQPGPPDAPVEVHPDSLAGEAAAEKRGRLAEKISGAGQDAVFLSLPDSIAWLLNIRGRDIPHTPVALAFAVLRSDARVDLFIDPAKVSEAVAAHFGDGVQVLPPDGLAGALDDLGRDNAVVGLEYATAPQWARRRLEEAGATVVSQADPCQLPKACKNPVEIDGVRAAHVRDGAALTRFLAWLDGMPTDGGLTELAAANRLQAFREELPELRDLSFSTIAGAGPNGAVVHYRVSPETDRRLEPGSLFLVDSGGQYPDGTTDVTRTVAIGTPTDEMRDRFTRVLRGHIALATARFPEGTTGSQLDVLARRPLWEVGLDYDHGTGHGVGAYLGVHEGPQRISKAPNNVALRAGMVISNEPGYYKTGEYGIRIENLVVVREANGLDAGKVFEFETLTLAPLDRRLIDAASLAEDELAWLDAYHERVASTLSPVVDAATRAWLEAAAAPLGPA